MFDYLFSSLDHNSQQKEIEKLQERIEKLERELNLMGMAIKRLEAGERMLTERTQPLMMIGTNLTSNKP